MRCSRCGARPRHASWYCAKCGAALGGVNLAYTVEGEGRGGALPGLAAGAAIALAVVGAAAVATTPGRIGRLMAALPGDRGAGAATAPAPKAALATATDPPRAATVLPPVQSGDGPGAAAAATDAPAPTATGEPVALARTRRDGPVWVIARQERPPALDGRLDDWRSGAFDVANVAFGADFWDGPADLSARAFVAWDTGGLYLGVRVTDDHFSQPSAGTDLHLGDSVELQLDTDLMGDWDDATYSADDWQIGLSPGDFEGRPPEAVIWRPQGGDASAIRVASRRLADGYILEAAVPWATLAVDPASSDRLGIAVNVSDNDFPAPAQVTLLSSTKNRSWADPRTFGTLVLEYGGAHALARPLGPEG